MIISPFPKTPNNGKPKSLQEKIIESLKKIKPKSGGWLPDPGVLLKKLTQKEIGLEAAHWNHRTNVARFHVHLAVNNSPPMKIGSGHTAEAIILVKEAYNLIGFAPNLAQYPPIAETGIYDIVTSVAIGKFQSEFGLTVDGVAGRQTILAMDDLLLEIEQGAKAI